MLRLICLQVELNCLLHLFGQLSLTPRQVPNRGLFGTWTHRKKKPYNTYYIFNIMILNYFFWISKMFFFFLNNLINTHLSVTWVSKLFSLGPILENMINPQATNTTEILTVEESCTKLAHMIYLLNQTTFWKPLLRRQEAAPYQN